MKTVLSVAVLLFLAACSSRAPAPVPRPEGPEGRLWSALELPLQSPEQERELAAVDSLTDGGLGRLLAETAANPSAPPLLRGGALLLLGQRREQSFLWAFERALEADDPRVRAAAATGLGPLLPRRPERTAALLERALGDPDALVQAKALESLADYDVEILRRYAATARDAELRRVAQELVYVAEQRGAPVPPATPTDSTVLVKSNPAGPQVVFRATRRWPRWNASVGELLLVHSAGDTVRLAEGVEVVGGVVPAFFSPDEAYLVYEAGREIWVRNLSAGTDWRVGTGLAPRPLPFSSDFLYLRERRADREQQRPASQLRYDVLRVPFTGGEPALVGVLTASPSVTLHGNYSPVRWARIRERDGVFLMEGEGLETVRLPDPFTGAAPGT